MAKTYDVAILGATPAGLAAAYALAKDKADVVVVDAPQQDIESPLAEWLPKTFFSLTGVPKGLPKAAKARAFRRVCYHNAALEKQVDYRARSTAGHFVQMASLVKAMKSAASKAGATVRSSTTNPAIRLDEDHVELLGSRPARAKFLIIAHSRPNDVLSELAMPLRAIPDRSLLVAGLDVPVSGKRVDTQIPPGEMHVVELPERSELGLFFEANGVLHARVISNSAAAGTRAAELSGMLTDLQQAELLGPNLPLGRAKGAVWSPPAGAALDLETHVAKRCLLTGTAGGFVESITGQSILPSVRSSLLAVEIIREAAAADNPQDTLMKYKTAWRKILADYLRPPNTSLHMLLPLLFVNQRIVSKFTRALLYGENI